MDFEVWPEAIELGRLFAEQGYELALVGGPVRDLLLHRKSHDLDFCSSARPEQFEPILRRWGHDGFWDMGRKFGTLGAMRRRPDLDGNEIMELLGLEPGPMIGRAYKHMLEYRLDNGPVDHDVAVEELKRWYAEIQ